MTHIVICLKTSQYPSFVSWWKLQVTRKILSACPCCTRYPQAKYRHIFILTICLYVIIIQVISEKNKSCSLLYMSAHHVNIVQWVRVKFCLLCKGFYVKQYDNLTSILYGVRNHNWNMFLIFCFITNCIWMLHPATSDIMNWTVNLDQDLHGSPFTMIMFLQVWKGLEC